MADAKGERSIKPPSRANSFDSKESDSEAQSAGAAPKPWQLKGQRSDASLGSTGLRSRTSSKDIPSDDENVIATRAKRSAPGQDAPIEISEARGRRSPSPGSLTDEGGDSGKSGAQKPWKKKPSPRPKGSEGGIAAEGSDIEVVESRPRNAPKPSSADVVASSAPPIKPWQKPPSVSEDSAGKHPASRSRTSSKDVPPDQSDDIAIAVPAGKKPAARQEQPGGASVGAASRPSESPGVRRGKVPEDPAPGSEPKPQSSRPRTSSKDVPASGEEETKPTASRKELPLRNNDRTEADTVSDAGAETSNQPRKPVAPKAPPSSQSGAAPRKPWQKGTPRLDSTTSSADEDLVIVAGKKPPTKPGQAGREPDIADSADEKEEKEEEIEHKDPVAPPLRAKEGLDQGTPATTAKPTKSSPSATPASGAEASATEPSPAAAPTPATNPDPSDPAPVNAPSGSSKRVKSWLKPWANDKSAKGKSGKGKDEDEVAVEIVDKRRPAAAAETIRAGGDGNQPAPAASGTPVEPVAEPAAGKPASISSPSSAPKNRTDAGAAPPDARSPQQAGSPAATAATAAATSTSGTDIVEPAGAKEGSKSWFKVPWGGKAKSKHESAEGASSGAQSSPPHAGTTAPSSERAAAEEAFHPTPDQLSNLGLPSSTAGPIAPAAANPPISAAASATEATPSSKPKPSESAASSTASASGAGSASTGGTGGGSGGGGGGGGGGDPSKGGQPPAGQKPPAKRQAGKPESEVKPKKKLFPWSYFRGKEAPSEESRGKPFVSLSNDTAAVKIQSSWRGKIARKLLWKQNFAAIDIQRVFRGMKEWKAFPSRLLNFKDSQKAKKRRQDSMRRIRNQERDFQLLQRIGPDQFRKFEEMRKSAKAKVIQKAWRNHLDQAGGAWQRGDQHYRRGSVRFKKINEKAMELRKSKEERAEEAKARKARQQLHESLQRTYSTYYSLSWQQPPAAKADFSQPEHALNLTYLHQRIREAAIHRIETDNKRSGVEAGMRRQYQALVQLQHQSARLLQDFAADRPIMEAEQQQRYQSLHNCQTRMQALRSPPSLQTMASLLNRPADMQHIPLDPQQQQAREWLVQEKIILPEDSSVHDQPQQRILEKAIHSHEQAKAAVLNTAKWSSVFLPRFESGDGASSAQSTVQTHFLRTDGTQASFKHLAGDWARGLDQDESLQWVTYACQRSNVLSEHLQTAASLPSEHVELLKKIYSSSYSPSQRKQMLEIVYREERDQITDLKQRILEEYRQSARNKLRIFGMSKKNASKLRQLSPEEIRLQAIVKVQCCIRRWQAVRRRNALLAQQRVYSALQHLLTEISQAQPGHRQGAAGGRGLPFFGHAAGEGMDALKAVVPRLLQPILPPPPSGQPSSTPLRPPSAAPTPLQAPSPQRQATVMPSTSQPMASIFADMRSMAHSQAAGELSAGKSAVHSLDPVRAPLNSQFSVRHAHAPPTMATPLTGGKGVPQSTPYTDPFARLTNAADPTASTTRAQEAPPSGLSLSAIRPSGLTVQTNLTARSAHGPSSSSSAAQLSGHAPHAHPPLAASSSSSHSTPVPSASAGRPDRVRFALDANQGSAYTPLSLPNFPSSIAVTTPQASPRQSRASSLLSDHREGVAVRSPYPSSPPHTPPSTSASRARAHPSASPARHKSPHHPPSSATSSGGRSADGSALLSPFLELPQTHEEDLDYISTPSHSASQSLSRSLTASFGMVEGLGQSIRSSASRSGGLTDAMYPAPGEKAVDVLVEVEKRFKAGKCHMTSLVHSALHADVGNFRKNAALDGLEVILEVVGTKPLISWLQRFAAKKAGAHRSDSTSPPDAMDSTLSVEASEIQVESLTLLLCEILSMFYDEDSRDLSEDEIHSMIQMTMLISLLNQPAGMAPNLIRLAALAGLCEDLWIQRLPPDYFDTYLILSKVRASIVRKSFKAATNPHEVCTSVIASVVAQAEGASPVRTAPSLQSLSSLSVPLLTKVLLKLCPAHVFSPPDISPMLRSSLRSSREKMDSSSLAHLTSESTATSVAEHVARLLIQFVNWDEQATEANTQALLAMLCCLPSYRNLQKRLQAWFRLVPSMMNSLLSLFPGAMASATEFTVKLSTTSETPLTLAEARLLAQLLSHRTRVNVSGGSMDSQVDDESAVLDVKLLYRIQAGDFIQAAL